jgi:riboflavin kinase/FMN adenylyltransferase
MEKTVVTVGTFDGVHRGHQAVLRATRRLARRLSLPSVAFAFDVPPRHHISDADAGRLLLPPDVKKRLLLRFVDRVVDASFPALRSLEPEQFIDSVLLGQLHAAGAVVSESFRFAHDRRGGAETLTHFGAERGLLVDVIPTMQFEGRPISSTRIREVIRAGEIETATQLLGHPPLLAGPVRTGDGVGRTLGLPTANLALDPRILLPCLGIYFARARADGADVPSLVYIGTRPTFGGAEVRCEVHLLVSPVRNLVGKVIEVALLQRIRGDQRFGTVEELRLQMKKDLAVARSLQEAEAAGDQCARARS